MSPPPLLLLLLLLLPLSIQTTHSIPTIQSSAALRRPTRHLLSHQPNPLAPTPSPSPSPSASPPAHAHARAHHHHKKHRARNWVIGFFVGLFSGVLSGVLFSILFRLLVNCIKGNFNKIAGPSIYSPLIKNSDALSFLEKDDALSSLELIGRGGCGEVYRTELPGSAGRMIAIKRVVQPTADALELGPEENSKLLNKRMRQIRSEINTVGQIRHRNLLPLLAHVTRPECHYLVYEYMKNGSLHDALKGVENGSHVLEWKTRHNIAVGISSGLEYLHMLHRPRIIHRDLKPANILLDDDLEARIADFGLAKAIPDANTHVTTSAVAGTVGYIAPEYHQSLKFTDKSDIYSFGVILAVLVIGRHPSDDFFQATEEMGLVKWLRRVVSSEQPAEAIDPSLRGNGFEEQILLVLKIACFCTADDPTQRPNSKDVRCMLTQIKH